MYAQRTRILAGIFLLSVTAAGAQGSDEPMMQRFVIEREITGADQMTTGQLRDAAAKSNVVLSELGPDIEWLHSYVAGDKLYCVYRARNAELIKRHSEISGFPANRITPVSAVIDPGTASSRP